MLEVLKQTPAGQELYDKFMKTKEVKSEPTIVVDTIETEDI
jgi:hypothetical protein